MKALVRCAMLILCAAPNTLGAVDCADTSIQQVQKQTAVALPQYSKQILLAREAFLEIYDHGLIGNSGSAINKIISRPPGMSIAVAVNGQVVWAEGFGIADLEQCVPVTPKTKFRIVSTSKPLTSARAMLLYEQNRLDLDAPIQRYVPSFPTRAMSSRRANSLAI